MGKSGNIPLKNQLVNMKHRLVKELSKKMSKETDYAIDIRGNLEEKKLRGNFYSDPSYHLLEYFYC